VIRNLTGWPVFDCSFPEGDFCLQPKKEKPIKPVYNMTFNPDLRAGSHVFVTQRKH
jgi:hypothetical protein